jgi:hypothetical protein
MSPTIEKIKKEVEELSVGEMVELHEKLIERIHARDEKYGLEPGFKSALERRIRDVDDGKVEGRDAFEGLKEI